MFITKCNSSAVEYFCLDHHRRLTSTPPPPLALSSSISFEAFSMIVPTMQRIDSNSPELSNQRSVIAKSVSNQVVPVTVLCEHEPEQPQLVKGPSCSPVQYPIIDTVTPGSSASPAHSPSLATTPPLFLLSANSSPVHSSMPANGSSYDYYGYELLKGKRKPIPVPSESKDDAYWERRRRNNLSGKLTVPIISVSNILTSSHPCSLQPKCPVSIGDSERCRQTSASCTWNRRTSSCKPKLASFAKSSSDSVRMNSCPTWWDGTSDTPQHCLFVCVFRHFLKNWLFVAFPHFLTFSPFFDDQHTSGIIFIVLIIVPN